MKFKIQIVIDYEQSQTQIEDILEIEKDCTHGYTSGISLQESKQLLKKLQKTIILQQANAHIHL